MRKQLWQLILLGLFLPSAFAHSKVDTDNCLLSVTLTGEFPYFLEKSFDQWKSEANSPSYLSCAGGSISYPVQVVLTSRSFSFGYQKNSKIRLSIVIPNEKIGHIFDRQFSMGLNEKQLYFDDVYDSMFLEKVEIYIDNPLSKNELEAISQSTLLIKSLASEEGIVAPDASNLGLSPNSPNKK